MKNKYQHQIITIPNILSFFRLCLIPFFMWSYCIKEDIFLTAALLLLSGISDIADGTIARRFNMISDLGKVLDPIADKLTQLAMLLCLLIRFPAMIFLLVLLIVKEAIMAISGYMVIKKTGIVYGASWHGKITTCLLYLLMFLHVIWFDIPLVLSNFLIGTCFVLMIISLLLYGLRNIKALKKSNGE